MDENLYPLVMIIKIPATRVKLNVKSRPSGMTLDFRGFGI
jgi:hypothetical protein